MSDRAAAQRENKVLAARHQAPAVLPSCRAAPFSQLRAGAEQNRACPGRSYHAHPTHARGAQRISRFARLRLLRWKSSATGRAQALRLRGRDLARALAAQAFFAFGYPGKRHAPGRHPAAGLGSRGETSLPSDDNAGVRRNAIGRSSSKIPRLAGMVQPCLFVATR